MKDLSKRTFSSIFFVIVMVASILWNHYSFAFLFLIITIIGLNEFYKLLSKIVDSRPLRITGIVLGALTYTLIALVSIKILPLMAIAAVFLLLIVPFMFTVASRRDNNFLGGLITAAGIFFVAIPFGLLTMIGNPSTEEKQYFPALVLGFFLLMWVYDVFAYLSGSMFGKHSLAPKISPKKSWEGFIGGSIFTLLLAFLLPFIFEQLNFVEWAIVAVLIINFGTFGDLAESMLKRQAMVKDSGKLMPGHGGVLDRFDGVLFSAPAVLVYLLFIWK